MSDLRDQFRGHYEGKSLSPEKVKAILDGRGADVSRAENNIVPGPGFWRRHSLAVRAVAAAVLLFAGIGIWSMGRQPEVSYTVMMPGIVDFFHTPPELPKRSQDPKQLWAWMVAEGAPADFKIPEKLMPLKGLGCQVVKMAGRSSYLACFWREHDALVHVFVSRREDFRDVPPAVPRFRELSGWSLASWTDGDVIYTMATAAPMDKLRPFVTRPPDPDSGRMVLATLPQNPADF